VLFKAPSPLLFPVHFLFLPIVSPSSLRAHSFLSLSFSFLLCFPLPVLMMIEKRRQTFVLIFLLFFYSPSFSETLSFFPSMSIPIPSSPSLPLSLPLLPSFPRLLSVVLAVLSFFSLYMLIWGGGSIVCCLLFGWPLSFSLSERAHTHTESRQKAPIELHDKHLAFLPSLPPSFSFPRHLIEGGREGGREGGIKLLL
jgi:hypothetical protein